MVEMTHKNNNVNSNMEKKNVFLFKKKILCTSSKAVLFVVVVGLAIISMGLSMIPQNISFGVVH